MKKVLYDLLSCQSYNGSYTGGFEYIKTVFKEMTKLHGTAVELYAFYNFSYSIDAWIVHLIENKCIRTFDVKEKAELKSICLENDIEIFYTGLPYDYIVDYFPHNVKRKGTYHGLRLYESPCDKYMHKYMNYHQGFKEKLRSMILYNTQWGMNRIRESAVISYKSSLRYFDEICCVSYHSKYALLSLFNEEYDNIPVFYSPLKEGIEDEVEICTKKYILIISASRWRKNAYRGMIAIDNLQKKSFLQDYQTIIVGNASKVMRDEFQYNKKFIFMDYVSVEELEKLYAECSLFLFPTLNEGFGYPPLEAMRYGKTCVVSAVTSLPEIYGNAVYYINPYDIQEIEGRILQAIEKPINTQIIKKQFDEITLRQKKDLEDICQFIIK